MVKQGTCPNCGASEIKVKTVTVDRNTGNRVHLYEPIVGGILLAVGALFVLLGFANAFNSRGTPEATGQFIMSFALSLLFIVPAAFFLVPYLRANRKRLDECRCTRCKNVWRRMGREEVLLLKGWQPGSWGSVSDVQIELGPGWAFLSTPNKKVHIRRADASSQIDFTDPPFTGAGKSSDLNGLPVVHFGSVYGNVKNIVLKPDTYEKLRQWVPPATSKDLKKISLRKELQGWGAAFIVVAMIQGFIYTNISKSNLSLSDSMMVLLALVFLLFVVGALNFLFVNSMMLIVNGVALIAIGVSNIASGNSYWPLLGLLQLGWGGTEFWRFVQYAQPDKAAASAQAKPVEVPTDSTTSIQPDTPMPDLEQLVSPIEPDDAQDA